MKKTNIPPCQCRATKHKKWVYPGAIYISPCQCGETPELYSYTCHTHAGSEETVTFYRYICPVCHEWADSSLSKIVARRFWNETRDGERKRYWHNADMQNEFNLWEKVQDN